MIQKPFNLITRITSRVSFSHVLTLVLLTIVFTSHSQGLLGGGGGEGDRIDGKFKFLPLPYVDYNRAVGVTLGAIPMAMMNLSEKDTISPSSTVGLVGTYSENKTWFVMGFGVFYLDEDNWRIKAAGGYGDVNYQFYAANPIDQWFRYNTNADFLYVSVQKQIIPDLYAGLGYIYTTFKTSTDFFEREFTTQLHGIVIDATYDRRSSVTYPRDGYFLQGRFRMYPQFANDQNDSNQMTLAYNHYFPMVGRRDVLAARFYSGLSFGDVSFNQQFIVGGTDIRGYSFGQFRGKSVIAAQGEYRWNFHKRFGAVGFAGLATVLGSFNETDEGRLLPGIGTGVRYVFLKETHSTVGFDVAVGDGDWGFYFRLSEAF